MQRNTNGHNVAVA